MSEFYLDEKVTLWQRSYFQCEEDMLLAIELLKEGKSYSEIAMEVEIDSTEELLETMEPITLQENGFKSTIEVYKDKEKVFDNGCTKVL